MQGAGRRPVTDDWNRCGRALVLRMRHESNEPEVVPVADEACFDFGGRGACARARSACDPEQIRIAAHVMAVSLSSFKLAFAIG